MFCCRFMNKKLWLCDWASFWRESCLMVINMETIISCRILCNADGAGPGSNPGSKKLQIYRCAKFPYVHFQELFIFCPNRGVLVALSIWNLFQSLARITILSKIDIRPATFFYLVQIFHVWQDFFFSKWNQQTYLTIPFSIYVGYMCLSPMRKKNGSLPSPVYVFCIHISSSV